MHKESKEHNTVQVGVVGIIMNDKNQVLLARRLGKSHEGMWGLPSGTIQPGETAKETLVREMKEELGIEITSIKFTGYFYDTHGRDPRYATAIDLPFICYIQNGTPQPLHESSELRWFNPGEFDDQCLPYDQRQMLIEAGVIIPAVK